MRKKYLSTSALKEKHAHVLPLLENFQTFKSSFILVFRDTKVYQLYSKLGFYLQKSKDIV